MTIHALTLGDYQVNCYIVAEADRCVIIDPGYEPEKILAEIDRLKLTADAILLTHGHFDHVGGAKALAEATGCALWMHDGDRCPAGGPMTDFLYPLAKETLPDMCFCRDGDRICAGGLCFGVMATPGHTAGSVCYLCEDAMFSGDTLFAGSIGRTDLPGASESAMAQSLLRLKALDTDLRVFPGHGRGTTLDREKLQNPYLR